MSLFQESIIRKHLSSLDQEVVDQAYLRFKEVYSANKITNIKLAKEEQYQEGFIKDIFGAVLGYSVFPEQPFNIQTEKKNESDSKKADGAIFQGENVVGVIELKDNKTKNLDAVKDQAFGYKNNHKECSYVISSNFHKLRFYVDDATEYEEFDLYNLDKETFKRFYLYLRKEGLLDKNIPKLLRQETKFHEENISKSLYKDYSTFKNNFFQNVVKNNPQYDNLILFKKSQKFLDKVLFVLFAEDKGLVTTNSIVQIVEKWQDLKNDAFDTPKPLYELVALFFNNLFIGKKDQKGYVLIPEFGGEIFAPDEVLDSLIVDDAILKDDLLKLSKYDFNTDVDVNILGHIFEHSLSEIEEVEAELKGEVADKSKGKRKKDGVFYTPKYITKYIVENTIGKLCSDKKTELKLDVDVNIFEYQKADGKPNAKGIVLYETLNQYKAWLLTLKILDPACGSGAFLNQAVNFLIQEHQFIDDIISELTNTPLRLYDTDIAILENNIYGVDINEESVEIAKLSLWLRTARQGRKLSNLSNNIKCGNSLIDDPAVAGDKAFNWQKEFPEVFAKGGFDVVIGNPPYLLCQPSNTDAKKLNYFHKYEVSSYKIDLFHLFFEKSIILLKEKGKLGFITPNTYLTNKYIQKLRSFILKNTFIETLVNYEDGVFVDAGVDVATIILKKEKSSNESIEIFNSKLGTIHQFGLKKQNDWSNEIENTFNIKQELKFNLKKCVKFEDIGNSYFGIQAYDRKKSILNTKENECYLPLIDGADINRYELSKPNKFINFIPENIKSGGDYSVYERLRIVVRQIGQTPIIGLCEPNILTSNTLYNLYMKNENYSLKYVLTILNSKVIKKYWIANYSDSKQLFPKIKGYQLKQLPIPTATKIEQMSFIEKADTMLSFNKELQENSQNFQRSLERKFALTELPKKLEDWHLLSYAEFIKELGKKKIKLSLSEEAEWETYFTKEAQKVLELKSNIEKTDKEIDQMVYALYELTEDEIKVVEES